MHFFNPAPVMALVEVIATQRTAADVVEAAAALRHGAVREAGRAL
ncbi:MAG: 3-hydroxyacyl-CoA dehydrogenase NAD-binding domain-containing protein [Acidimicrobiales bacterium]